LLAQRIFSFEILVVWQQGITGEKRKENYLNLPVVVLFFSFFLGILPTLLFLSSFVVSVDTPCKISNCCQTVQMKAFQIFYEATMQLLGKQNRCCCHQMQTTSLGRQFDRSFFLMAGTYNTGRPDFLCCIYCSLAK
jgi:hypothetical protein